MVNFLLLVAFLTVTACGIKSYSDSSVNQGLNKEVVLSIDTDLNELYAYHVLSLSFNEQGEAQKSIIAKNFANRKLKSIKNRFLVQDTNLVESSLLNFSNRSLLHSEVAKEIDSDLNKYPALKLPKKSVAQAMEEIRIENTKFQIFIANIEHTALITRH